MSRNAHRVIKDAPESDDIAGVKLQRRQRPQPVRASDCETMFELAICHAPPVIVAAKIRAEHEIVSMPFERGYDK